MGGNDYNNSRQKKSSSNSGFSMFNLFRSKKISQVKVEEYEAPNTAGRAWRSDDDRGRYWPVAEPGIDRKAKAYIDKIHRNIATDYECKTFTIPSTTASKA